MAYRKTALAQMRKNANATFSHRMTQPNLARDTWLKIVLNSCIWGLSSIKGKTTIWDKQACKRTLSWGYQESLVKRNCRSVWKMQRAGERKGVWRKEKPAQGAELQRTCLEKKKPLGSGTLVSHHSHSREHISREHWIRNPLRLLPEPGKLLTCLS